MKNLKTILALLAFTLMAALAFAKEHPNGHGNGKNKHSDAAKPSEAPKTENKPSKESNSGKIVFTMKEREVLQTYANANTKSLPPGLAKKAARGKELPPGWQKKLSVGQPIPDEVFKVACPLPKDLIVKLPPSPVGTITVAVEGKIVRLMEKSKEILDILDLPTPKF